MSQKGSLVDIPGKVTLHDIDLPVNDMPIWVTSFAMFKPPLFSFWLIPPGPVKVNGNENKGRVTKQNLVCLNFIISPSQ